MSRYTQTFFDSMKSDYQHWIEAFMLRRGLPIPDEPTSIIDDELRLVITKLLVEEFFETLDAIGVNLRFDNVNLNKAYQNKDFSVFDFDFDVTSHFDIVGVVDGHCDIRFVLTQLLSLCGVPDKPFFDMVGQNNLMKFSAGHHIDEHGKLIKPEDHPKPEIAKLLEGMMSRGKREKNEQTD